MGNAQLQALIGSMKRGYRSNKYLDQIRPSVHLKQKWLLSLDELEVFFGGAAGGGKSDALLMSALQFCDIPEYAAILFRRTYADLSLPGALMDRANQWLTRTDAIKKDGGKRWDFPGGGTLQFAYLQNEGDCYRYQGAEFQFVGFDELCHFPETDYTYLFSRLRKPKILPSDSEADRNTKKLLAQVPLRMRSASNPGGKYGEWVKHRFITKRYLKATEEEQFSKVWVKTGVCSLCNGLGYVVIKNKEEPCFSCKGKKQSKKFFIPARLEDNPSLDIQGYEESLSKLSSEERQRLRHGRWDIMSEGHLFKREWIKPFIWRGDHIILHTIAGEKLQSSEKIWFFMTADTASKEKTHNDNTCFCCWAVTPGYNLCLVDIFRDKLATPYIIEAIKIMYAKWKASFVMIEEASSGIAIIQEATLTERGQGITVFPFVPHGTDKVARSHQAQIRMKGHQIFFPASDDDTLQDTLNELLEFPDGAHDDFVDNISMAAKYVYDKSLESFAGTRTEHKQVTPGKQLPIYNSRFNVRHY